MESLCLAGWCSITDLYAQPQSGSFSKGRWLTVYQIIQLSKNMLYGCHFGQAGPEVRWCSFLCSQWDNITNKKPAEKPGGFP